MAYKRSPYPMHKGTSSHKSAVKQKEIATELAATKGAFSKGNKRAKEFLKGTAAQTTANPKPAKPSQLNDFDLDEYNKLYNTNPKTAKPSSVSDFDETKAYQKRWNQLIEQGFTPEDADQMIKNKAVTGEVKQKFPHDKETPKTEKSPAKQGLILDENNKELEKIQIAGESNRKYKKRLKGKVEKGEMSKEEFKGTKKRLRKNLPHKIKSDIKHAVKNVSAKVRNKQATRIATKHSRAEEGSKKQQRLEKKMERKGIETPEQNQARYSPKESYTGSKTAYSRKTKDGLGAYNIEPKKKKSQSH